MAAKATTNDSDWVADIRRWVAARRPLPLATAGGADDLDLGYEAADPALQARHWPDAPPSALADPG